MAFLPNLFGFCPPDDEDVVTVKQYRYKNGDLPEPKYLGFTYKKGAGYVSMVAWVLTLDADPDKIVRVIVHELLNTLVLGDGREYPRSVGLGWYVQESDTLAPYAPITPEEAQWIAEHGKEARRVVVDDEDVSWLVQPTRDACKRLNDAAGRIVFRYVKST